MPQEQARMMELIKEVHTAVRCAIRAPRPAVCAKSALGRRQDPRQGNGVIFISGDVHVRALRPPAAH